MKLISGIAALSLLPVGCGKDGASAADNDTSTVDTTSQAGDTSAVADMTGAGVLADGEGAGLGNAGVGIGVDVGAGVAIGVANVEANLVLQIAQ